MCAPFRPGRTSSSQGIGGHFIPPSADYFYMDSYQTSEIVPASQSPSVRHFISELDAKGKRFNGFASTGGEFGSGRTGTRPITGGQWRMTDAASQDACARVAAQ
jgi:hypothetical protein